MPLETDGFDSLMTDIAGMASRMDADGSGAPVAKRILEAAAQPIHQQMKANATKDPRRRSGDLHDALKVGSVRRSKKRGRHITIGVHRKDWSHEDYYPAFVEYGHGGPAPAPAHPYIRPAYDTRVDEAYERLEENSLWQALPHPRRSPRPWVLKTWSSHR